jgi:hypothetical protein
MIKRLLSILLIISCASAAWMALSVNTRLRTFERKDSLGNVVSGLWGTRHSQRAPLVMLSWHRTRQVKMTDKQRLEYLENKREEEIIKAKLEGRKPSVINVPESLYRNVEETISEDALLSGSSIGVKINLDHRRKGLLWFSTYTVAFDSEYIIENKNNFETTAVAEIPFPTQTADYENLVINADGAKELKYRAERNPNRIEAEFRMAPNSKVTLQFAYKSRGLDEWTYRLGDENKIVRNFHLTMITNFDGIDFPNNTISPDIKEKKKEQDGWKLTWEKDSMVSGFNIGMEMPRKLNPGPLASSMAAHAPVSLLFYFFVIFLLQTMRGIKLHPMNYFFLACAFFSFNLLFSYMVDHVTLWLSFAATATVSLALVVSYLRLVVNARFAIIEAGAAQLIYQIMFAVAHFYEGYTGLSITIGAIFTLAVVMRLTAGIDWDEAFADRTWGTMVQKQVDDQCSPPSQAME